jgi:hypothetical protein
MESRGEFAVMLSDQLIEHLYHLSQEADVPLRWLVAGLVCDTIETLGDERARRLRGAAPSRKRSRA